MIDQKHQNTTEIHFTNLSADCSPSVGRVLPKPFEDAIADADAEKMLNSNRIMRGGLRVWRFGVEGSPDKVHAPRLGEVGSGQPVHPIAQAVAQARTDFGQVSISAAESFSTYSREMDYVDW